jgi:high-affinity iron transporter
MTAFFLASFLVVPPAFADGPTTFANSCAMCHGAGGKGDGVAAAAMIPKPADFTAANFWSTRTVEGVRKIIAEGGAATGRSSQMPAWGASLSDAQIEELILYIQALSN